MEDDFQKLAITLSNEALLGNIHLNMCEGILQMDKNVLNYAGTFFTYTWHAHMQAAHMYAWKLFDLEKSAWTVYKFLRTCCRRRAEFAFATEAEVLDYIADSGEIIRSLRSSLKILERRRHSHIAHISKELVFDLERLKQGPHLPIAELRRILMSGGQMVRELMFKWCEQSYPIQDNDDDYKQVNNMMCDSVDAQYDKEEAQAKKVGIKGWHRERPKRLE
jgi:hypothetical protein